MTDRRNDRQPKFNKAPTCFQSGAILSKGERMFIVHAGTKNAFIPGANLDFKAGSITGDYPEINFENFRKLLGENLILI